MVKVGIIGSGDSVSGFTALGFDACQADNVPSAVETLKQMVRSESYAVIFLTEDLAAEMKDALDAYKDMTLPAIVTVPSEKGSTGYGKNALRDAVVRAVGADILFNDK